MTSCSPDERTAALAVVVPADPIAEYIARMVADAPPLTVEQGRQLQALLSPSVAVRKPVRRSDVAA